MDYANDHPERAPHEVYLGNFFSPHAWSRAGRKSKRPGEIAYDINGRVIYNAFPGFRDASETMED